MPFLGARSWLRPLIALHALVEGLAGFHSLPGLQGGTVLLWFPVLPEHQEAAASSAPHGTESTEESDSSDDDDIDPSLPEGSERVSRRSSRWSASGETPVSQQGSSRAPSEPARNVEEQLELLRAERRRLAARMRRLRLLWSGEEVFVRMCIHKESVRRHRKGKPAVTPSTERIAKLRSLYQQRSNEKKQEMLQLQREIQAVAKQKTQLHQEWRLLRIRGSRGTHGWEAQPGSSTSTDESQSESPNADLLSTESAAHTSSPEKTWHTATTSCTASDASHSSCRLDSTNRRICGPGGPRLLMWGTDSGAAPLRPNPKAAVPVRADEDKRGTPFSELTLIRAQKANLLAMRRTIRNKWKSQTAYVNMRMHEINFHRKGKGLPPLELTPELLRDFSSQYNQKVGERMKRVESITEQIKALEQKGKGVVRCRRADPLRTSAAHESDKSCPTGASGKEPATAPELSTQPALQFHRQVPSTDSTLQVASTSHLLSAAPGAPPSREQVPILSWGPVSTTDGARLESQSALPALGSAGRSHTTTAARSAHIIGPPCVAPPSCLWQHQETPVQLGSTESPSAAPDPFPQYSPSDTSAASYAIPCRTGDSGETQYPSPSQLEQHAAACSPGRFEPGSELPAELLEFILDHSTAASAVSAHTSAVLEKPVPLPAEPWSPGIAFPNIVSPSEQPSTSHWWPDPPSSSSDRRLWPSAPFEGRLSSPWPWGS
ncbi:hypothetical protein TGME49_245770 [Toxoplasma gondii ME49]|uniref:Transmembrane protein n=2 Tax=Toxoplasma gondii TaxID=5811 RepID=S8ENG3_TOXGM|nr:hypothetical protein TGME49_245770 [Toxoplasma gondii ME49]EPT24821.1 hypothetical protein TGME49_245770 [Toxoplasma gondii ME49]|eukprot:XP_018634900.1 hypothetical protein TGME49_245770 [Toxoplasma gondii ME49]